MRQTWSTDTASEIREFVDNILHGDDTHKAWLIRAGEEFIYNGKVTTFDKRKT